MMKLKRHVYGRVLFATLLMMAIVGLVLLGEEGRSLAEYAAGYTFSEMLRGIPIETIVAYVYHNFGLWYSYPVIDPYLALLIASVCVLTFVMVPIAWICLEVNRVKYLRQRQSDEHELNN